MKVVSKMVHPGLEEYAKEWVGDLRECSINDFLSVTKVDMIKAFLKSLEYNKTLTRLCLPSDVVDIEVVKEVGELLKKNKTIRQLNFSNYDSTRVEIIAEALKSNETLQALSMLGFNADMGNAGVIALASMLETNNSITHLCIDGISIGPIGIEFLARALKSNRGLQCLIVRDLKIHVNNNSVFRAFKDTLKTNTFLDFVGLNETVTHKTIRSTLKVYLDRNKRFNWLRENRYIERRDIILSILRNYSLQDLLDELMSYCREEKDGKNEYEILKELTAIEKSNESDRV